ncbi:putative cytoplasmic protein [Candidatus Zixiibacteriota bacterium]|nr:putative cytoplasmic protein [candidate division Zixibacteria bacterium]
MPNNDRHKKEECQLEVVYEAGIPPTSMDRTRNLLLRILSAFRRRTYKSKYGPLSNYVGGPGIGVSDDPNERITVGTGPEPKIVFSPGETVIIKAVTEIQATLDKDGRCEGLQFMLGMRKYCGQEARVLKKVRTIFDERLWKMVKIRDAYLLEKVTCDGRDVFDGEGCDRTCYFFWKSRWLRKKN